MREIKFRQLIWDYDDDKLLEWHYWGIVNGKFIEPIINGVNPENNYKSQQLTGLKDKNGKDIYEGDIIRKSFIIRINKNNIEDLKHYHKEKLIIGEDIDDGLISEVYWDNEESEFNFGKCGLFKEWDKIEVIGNIFENPELINHPLT